MPNELRGLLVEVYRAAGRGDCSLGGVTAKHNHLLLVGPGVAEVFPVCDRNPAVRLVRNARTRHTYAVPIECVGDGTGEYMMGGNFIYSCDSRFRNLNNGPIPVHDRSVEAERDCGRKMNGGFQTGNAEASVGKESR